MKQRKGGVKVGKERDSDEENEINTEENQVRALTPEEIAQRELEAAPVIPASEISPAAHMFMNQEEQDDINIYEEKSTKIKCPFCDAVSNSIVEYKPSLLGYLLTMLAMLIFGILSLALMPLLVSLTKTAIHRCAKCLNEVKDNSYFGFSSMDDKLMAFQIGSFGIILTRKLLLYMVLVLTAILSIYVFVLVEEAHIHDGVPITSITWSQYKRDAGFDAFAQNPRKAFINFERNYFRKGVSWDGYVVRVNLNDDDPLSMAYHSASILIKMDEDDREGVHGPDIGLSLSEYTLLKFSDEVGSLHRGDHIQFNGTIHTMGDSHHLHHLHVFGLKKLQGHRDVEAHAHSNGRYKVRIEPHDGKEHPELAAQTQTGSQSTNQYDSKAGAESYLDDDDPYSG